MHNAADQLSRADTVVVAKVASSAQVQARDFSALAHVTSAMNSEDDGFRAARRDVAWALDGVSNRQPRSSRR